ncbi:MAG: tetratricopeptide repeat protein [Chloroflexi bacterium]|nr:tetratricopeptide repeat protein [Chloroflexota bacterium]
MPRKRNFWLAPLDLPLLLFLLSAVFGLWPAYDRSLCWNTLIALVAGVLFYVLVSRLAVSHHWWRAIAIFIVSMSALLSLYFITQYDHFGYPEKIKMVNRLGAFIGGIVPSVAIWIPVDNSVAAFLEGGLFLAIALVLAEKQYKWRICGGIGVGLIALALLMSTARGAWLAVLVALALWLTLYWRPARVIFVVGALLALGLAIYTVVQRDAMVLMDIPIINRILIPLFNRSGQFDVYRNSFYLIQDFLLTGIGLGKQFAMEYPLYALLVRHQFLTCSHNLYLEVWLEQGLLGIVAMLWLITALYQTARTVAKRGADFLYQGAWLGLTAIFLHGIIDARPYVDLWCWFPFFGLLGLNAAVSLRRASIIPRGKHWVLPASVVGIFLVTILVSFAPLPATWHANQGCVLQARADLLVSLDDRQKASLRQQAVAHYERAIQIAPDNRTAQQRLGLILVDEMQFQDAVEHLEAAWQSDPNNTTTHKALGLAYVWVGELEKAQPLLQDVKDIVSELNTWAWWRGNQQQMEQSLNAYRMSLLLDPDQPDVRERLEQLEAEL